MVGQLAGRASQGEPLCPSNWHQFPRRGCGVNSLPPLPLLRPSQRTEKPDACEHQVTGREQFASLAHRCRGAHKMQGQVGRQGAAMTQAIPDSLELRGQTLSSIPVGVKPRKQQEGWWGRGTEREGSQLSPLGYNG